MTPLGWYTLTAATQVIGSGVVSAVLASTDGKTTGAEAAVMAVVTLVALIAIAAAGALAVRATNGGR